MYKKKSLLIIIFFYLEKKREFLTYTLILKNKSLSTIYPYSSCVWGWESINKTVFNFYKKYQFYKEFEYDYQHEVCLEYCVEL